jgi:hypothetical protein
MGRLITRRKATLVDFRLEAGKAGLILTDSNGADAFIREAVRVGKGRDQVPVAGDAPESAGLVKLDRKLLSPYGADTAGALPEGFRKQLR